MVSYFNVEKQGQVIDKVVEYFTNLNGKWQISVMPDKKYGDRIVCFNAVKTIRRIAQINYQSFGIKLVKVGINFTLYFHDDGMVISRTRIEVPQGYFLSKKRRKKIKTRYFDIGTIKALVEGATL